MDEKRRMAGCVRACDSDPSTDFHLLLFIPPFLLICCVFHDHQIFCREERGSSPSSYRIRKSFPFFPKMGERVILMNHGWCDVRGGWCQRRRNISFVTFSSPRILFYIVPSRGERKWNPLSHVTHTWLLPSLSLSMLNLLIIFALLLQMEPVVWNR